jgi:acetoin utilization deacetylase AcuC-like enzyme
MRDQGCIEMIAKRRCTSLDRGSSRQLIVVMDENAKAEVETKQCIRKLRKLYSWKPQFPLVRRNKKIMKVIKMDKAASKTFAKATVVTSKKGLLTEAYCAYDKDVVEVLQDPKRYEFRRVKPDRNGYTMWAWNVSRRNSKSIIMQSDFRKKELCFMVSELERDLGVLGKSVDQLLAKKTHDVVAVNTHPGHHASPKKAVNYCALNNVAIVARLIKRQAPKLKVGVIDLDVHPGDGTHKFLQQQPDLVHAYVSIHTTIRFLNMNSKLGSNGLGLNWDEKRKVSVERFFANVEKVLSAWNDKKLDIIIVSMGFDTLKSDPDAKCLGFQMCPYHFREVGSMFAQRPEQIFILQEGGYNLNDTARAFDFLLKGFRRGRKIFANSAKR